MTRDDIIRTAKEAGLWQFLELQALLPELEHFAALVAAEKEQQMIRDGYRKCAEGQRTTQFCGLLDAAVKAEREACAKVCEEKAFQTEREAANADDDADTWACAINCAAAIRARSET